MKVVVVKVQELEARDVDGPRIDRSVFGVLLTVVSVPELYGTSPPFLSASYHLERSYGGLERASFTIDSKIVFLKSVHVKMSACLF